MKFIRVGSFLRTTKITGPTHNLLGLHLGETEPSEGIRAIDLKAAPPGPLAEAEVLRAAIEGVDALNRRLGTRLRIIGLEFMSDDSPIPRVYRELAEAIAEHKAADSPGVKFQIGDRVQVAASFTWARKVWGTVGPPPPLVGASGGPTAYYRDTQGVGRVIRSFWVKFDSPQLDADGDGPYGEAEIPEEYLCTPPNG